MSTYSAKELSQLKAKLDAELNQRSNIDDDLPSLLSDFSVEPKADISVKTEHLNKLVEPLQSDLLSNSSDNIPKSVVNKDTFKTLSAVKVRLANLESYTEDDVFTVNKSTKTLANTGCRGGCAGLCLSYCFATCSSSCVGACSITCANSTDYRTNSKGNTSPHGNDYENEGYGDKTKCSSGTCFSQCYGCTEECANNCSDACYGGCVGDCQSVCSRNCNSYCDNSCGGKCTATCGSGCAAKCNSGCFNSCQTGCNDSCSGSANSANNNIY